MDSGFTLKVCGSRVELRTASGFELTLESAFRAWREIAELCARHGLRRVLVVGPMKRSMDAVEALAAGGQALGKGLFGLKAALCWENFAPDHVSELFVANAATRGVEVRYFGKETEALAWLAKDAP